MTKPERAGLRERLIDAIDNRRFDNEFPEGLLYKDIEWLVDNCLLPQVEAAVKEVIGISEPLDGSNDRFIRKTLRDEQRQTLARLLGRGEDV